MADYKSMYYELLKAAEQAIEKIDDITAAAIISYNNDSLKTFLDLTKQVYLVSDSLRKAELRCEDIFIETCAPDPELETKNDDFSKNSFYHIS